MYHRTQPDRVRGRWPRVGEREREARCSRTLLINRSSVTLVCAVSGRVPSAAYGCPRCRADRRCASSHMIRSDSKGRCRSSPGAPGWQVDLRSTGTKVTGSNPVWRITSSRGRSGRDPSPQGRSRPALLLHRYTPLHPALTLCTRVRAGSAGSRQGRIRVQGASRLRPAHTAPVYPRTVKSPPAPCQAPRQRPRHKPPWTSRLSMPLGRPGLPMPPGLTPGLTPGD